MGTVIQMVRTAAPDQQTGVGPFRRFTGIPSRKAKASTVLNTIAMQEKPFFALTTQLLDSVRDHDFRTLAGLCDDDFGIVDIATTGGSVIIRNRAGWEEWFTGLFAQLDALRAQTWSEITGYEAVSSGEMGYSVVDFNQILVTEDEKLRFGVIATIIWKRVDGRWKESRYHSSLIGVEKI